jgi:hypothetical protein
MTTNDEKKKKTEIIRVEITSPNVKFEPLEFPISAATKEIVTAAFGNSMIASTYEQRVKITKVIEILRSSVPFMQSVEVGLFNLKTGLKLKVTICRE